MNDVQKLVRGQIYWRNAENYDRAIPGIISKNRPVLIFSNNTCLACSPAYTVIPITSNVDKELPTHVKIFMDGHENIILCEQLYTMSKRSLGGYIGTLSEDKVKEVEKAVQIQLGIIEVDAVEDKMKTPDVSHNDSAPAEQEKAINEVKKSVVKPTSTTTPSKNKSIKLTSIDGKVDKSAVNNFNTVVSRASDMLPSKTPRKIRHSWSDDKKLALINDVDSGKLTKQQIMDKYGITNSGTFYNTVRRFKSELTSGGSNNVNSKGSI